MKETGTVTAGLYTRLLLKRGGRHHHSTRHVACGEHEIAWASRVVWRARVVGGSLCLTFEGVKTA